MNPQQITEKLYATLNAHQCGSTVISASHVEELRQTLSDNLRSGLIDDAVHKQYAGYFDNMLKEDVSRAKSIIVVSIPQPILEVVFTINGEKRLTIIPPTYEYSIDETIATIIEQVLKPEGYRFIRAALPSKLLAVRSGLARYGKNNITYVNGFGSFHRLLAFYSDLPVVKDTWQDPQVMEECAHCNACIKKCPTGAIDPDRFQLHAEKCLTFHNESSDDFPTWIVKSSHHCLIGCIKCQQYCPVNKNIRSWTERFAEFSEEESSLLLAGAKQQDLSSYLKAKLEKTGLLDNPDTLARNLRCVMAASK